MIVMHRANYEALCRVFGVKPDAQPVRLFDGVDRSGEPSFVVLGAEPPPRGCCACCCGFTGPKTTPGCSQHVRDHCHSGNCPSGGAAASLHADCITGEAAMAMRTRVGALLSLAVKAAELPQHGPRGCDAGCLKCEAQRVLDGWPPCSLRVSRFEGWSSSCVRLRHHEGPCR